MASSSSPLSLSNLQLVLLCISYSILQAHEKGGKKTVKKTRKMKEGKKAKELTLCM